VGFFLPKDKLPKDAIRRLFGDTDAVQIHASIDGVGDFVGAANAIAEIVGSATGSFVHVGQPTDPAIIEIAETSPWWSNIFDGGGVLPDPTILEISDTNDLCCGGGIDVYDEGVLVQAGVECLDFIGADVAAQVGAPCVNIYIPPPSYVSHWNTNDGVTNAFVGDVTTTPRYVSLPTIEGMPFYAALWGGDGATHPTTRTSPLSWTTPEDFSCADLATNLTAQVTDPSGIIATVTATLNGTGLTTNGNISINVTAFGPDSDKYQARATISFNVAAQLPASGVFTVTITHDNPTDGGPYVYAQ